MIVVLGLLLVLTGISSYLVLIFVLHRFTYSTRIFDTVIGAGVALASMGWAVGGSGPMTLTAVLLGCSWFPVIRHELKLAGSRQLRLRKGDCIPAFHLLTTDDRVFTEQDLIAKAPALLAMYRGWWCPSSKSQVDELLSDYERLHQAGFTVFAASVDEPADAEPLQERVGDKITVLCSVTESLLDEVGVRDARGAPWFDRILFGAKRQDISMPAWLVIDRYGRIVFAYRATRLDNRARPADILACL